MFHFPYHRLLGPKIRHPIPTAPTPPTMAAFSLAPFRSQSHYVYYCTPLLPRNVERMTIVVYAGRSEAHMLGVSSVLECRNPSEKPTFEHSDTPICVKKHYRESRGYAIPFVLENGNWGFIHALTYLRMFISARLSAQCALYLQALEIKVQEKAYQVRPYLQAPTKEGGAHGQAHERIGSLLPV
eukprot:scaffold99071_cov38-Attheya_sp.AAC.2